MAIVDEDNLIPEVERMSYHQILNQYGHEPDHFLLEVEEDQGTMDMNDINYVIIVKAKATHVGHQKSKTYYSKAGSGAWLEEFEKDLKSDYFTKK